MGITKSEFSKLWNTPAGNNFKGLGNDCYGTWTQQDERELWFLIEEVSKINPKNILEIGSSHGGTLIFWDQMATIGGKIVSVDYNTNHGITLDFSNARSNIIFLRLDSHDQKTLETVKSVFDSDIDFLFIDGDHTYEGVKQDYEMYSSLVRPGGLIGFHDVIYDSEIQVNQYFEEIDAPKRRIDLVHGIGIVYK